LVLIIFINYINLKMKNFGFINKINKLNYVNYEKTEINYNNNKSIYNIVIPNNNIKQSQIQNPFNKNMNYYVCSYGGCGSTVLTSYLSNFGNVYHIHDRYPPSKLQYVGKINLNNDDINNNNYHDEWFNGIDIPENELKNYKVIFIYRNPIKAIYSRFVKNNKPYIKHLQNIKCDNNGFINFFDVIKYHKDLYKLEEFFDNYVVNNINKNYTVYCIKYENFWNNIKVFNKIIGIPDISTLYPAKQERNSKSLIEFDIILAKIYLNLFKKMNSMGFIYIVYPSLNYTNNDDINDNDINDNDINDNDINDNDINDNDINNNDINNNDINYSNINKIKK